MGEMEEDRVGEDDGESEGGRQSRLKGGVLY